MPVTYEARGLHKNVTQLATSSGFPALPIGVLLIKGASPASRISAGTSSLPRFDSMIPGSTEFIRMPSFAKSTASIRVIPMIACLDDPYFELEKRQRFIIEMSGCVSARENSQQKVVEYQHGQSQSRCSRSSLVYH